MVYQLVFWTNLFLHFFESKYVKQLIFNGSSVNNENEFLKLFKNIYPKAFLDLEIKIEDYFRKRSVSQKGYISIIYSPNGSSGSISSEPFWIAKCSLRTDDFIPRDSDLFSKMMEIEQHYINNYNRLFLVTQMFFKNLV